jgi:hypothetical protein
VEIPAAIGQVLMCRRGFFGCCRRRALFFRRGRLARPVHPGRPVKPLKEKAYSDFDFWPVQPRNQNLNKR